MISRNDLKCVSDGRSPRRRCVEHSSARTPATHARACSIARAPQRRGVAPHSLVQSPTPIDITIVVSQPQRPRSYHPFPPSLAHPSITCGLTARATSEQPQSPWHTISRSLASRRSHTPPLLYKPNIAPRVQSPTSVGLSIGTPPPSNHHSPHRPYLTPRLGYIWPRTAAPVTHACFAIDWRVADPMRQRVLPPARNSDAVPFHFTLACSGGPD